MFQLFQKLNVWFVGFGEVSLQLAQKFIQSRYFAALIASFPFFSRSFCASKNNWWLLCNSKTHGALQVPMCQYTLYNLPGWPVSSLQSLPHPAWRWRENNRSITLQGHKSLEMVLYIFLLPTLITIHYAFWVHHDANHGNILPNGAALQHLCTFFAVFLNSSSPVERRAMLPSCRITWEKLAAKTMGSIDWWIEDTLYLGNMKAKLCSWFVSVSLVIEEWV